MFTNTPTHLHTYTLSLTHLRFTVEALTPVRLSGYNAGSQLRGALGNVMRRAYCSAYPPSPQRGDVSPEAKRSGEGPGVRGDPAHAATCPVCWLLAANEHPGEERRGYALLPPLSPPDCYAPGERFSFGLTLFGNALRFLPYFVLAVPEMGRLGVGAGRGQFALRQVWAADPLFGDEFQPVLAEGEALVHTPTLMISAERVGDVAAQLSGRGRLSLNFLTPMRLVEDGQLLKVPDFGVFFARLLKRLDELNEQFADGERRPLDEVNALHACADRVRLIETQTRWVEVWSGSSRTGKETPLSGFVGLATYSAPPEVWAPLLPWLIWGQGTQVGKDVVKGNGWYELVAPGLRRYGSWLIADSRWQMASAPLAIGHAERRSASSEV